ncbi:MAG: 3,4-dihydroxy-2-butanone-4-phosphate synthase [Candidatus Micrarchaeia archaeon]
MEKLLKKTLLSNKPLLLYDGDGREKETDIIFYPKNITYKEVQFLRKNAGGLLCIAVSEELSNTLNLPFISDLLPENCRKLKIRKTPYGDKPAFSISINHRKTFTGITDTDRAKTIFSFFKVAKSKSRKKFLDNFYSPGHIFLLRAANPSKRCGHTELSTLLFSKIGLTPVAVLCEMLADNGKALDPGSAKRFAKKHNLLFLKKEDVLMLGEKK